MRNPREEYIKSHSLDFDAENNTCHTCTNNCECFDNYYYNHEKCPIWVEEE